MPFLEATDKIVGPFRMRVKRLRTPTGAEVERELGGTEDLDVLATAGSDYYLMKIGGGEYFTWDMKHEVGVDVAAGVDPLLVIALVIVSAPVGNGLASYQE